MSDGQKTKQQLLGELKGIRSRVVELEAALLNASAEKSRCWSVINAVGDGIIIIAPDFRILFQNPASRELKGDHKGELCYKAFKGKDNVCEQCPTVVVFKDGGTHRKEGRIGSVDTEITVSPVKDESGKIVAAVEVVRDITARKVAAGKLLQANERLRSVLDASPAAIIAMDYNGMIKLWSNSAERIFGWSEAEAMGRSCPIVPERDPGPARLLPGRDIRGLSVPSMEQRVRRKDGSPVDVLVSRSPLEVTGDCTGGLLCVITDITDRKKAEMELKTAHEELKQIFDSAVDGKMVLDRDLNITKVNDTLLSLFGMGREVLGKKCYDLFSCVVPFCHKETCCADRILRGEERVNVETEVLRTDGSKQIFSVNAVPFRNAAGEVAGVVENIRDVTGKKKMEEALLRAEKLESVGILAGGIAHDFNNLLQGVFGYISMARMGVDGNERADALLAQAEKALGMSVNLTTQLLTFSKGGKPATRKISLGPTIEDSTKFALSGAAAKARIDIGKGLWDIDADPGQIGQVIQNLVINANQAMPAGGLVEISARNVEIPKGCISLLPEGGKFVMISIGDSGIGIPERHLSRIFDPYFTTKQKGSGLGLSTSYSIVRNHGGAIDVASELNKGSVFIVYLPASGRTAEGVRPVSAADNGRRGRILVMDDEEILRDIVKEMVSSLGHAVECAANGEEAVEIFDRARHRGKPFDAVILDLTVRGGMGGEQTLRRLKQMSPGVKVVLSSGYGDGPVISNYKSYGFSALLKKPFLIGALKDTLNTVLG